MLYLESPAHNVMSTLKLSKAARRLIIETTVALISQGAQSPQLSLISATSLAPSLSAPFNDVIKRDFTSLLLLSFSFPIWPSPHLPFPFPLFLIFSFPLPFIPFPISPQMQREESGERCNTRSGPGPDKQHRRPSKLGMALQNGSAKWVDMPIFTNLCNLLSNQSKLS